MNETYFAFNLYGQIFVEIPLRLTNDSIKNQKVVDLARRVQDFFDEKGLFDYFKVYAIPDTKDDFSYDLRVRLRYDDLPVFDIPSIYTLSDIDDDYTSNGEILVHNPQRMPHAIVTDSLDKILKWAKPIIAREIAGAPNPDDIQLVDAILRNAGNIGNIPIN